MSFLNRQVRPASSSVRWTIGGITLLLVLFQPLVAQQPGPGRTIITPTSHPTVIESLGDVNSSGDDFAPAALSDGRLLYFTSTRGGDQDVYTTVLTGTSWAAPTGAGSTLNTSGDDGGTAITPDGHWMVFTACDRSDGMGDCDLYIAEFIGGIWQNVRNLGSSVNSAAWDSQPAISPDGRILFFASERPGGIGGTDIWWTQRRLDGGWDPPVNLGRRINTAGDETAPAIAADNRTLYFSSDALPGIGGFDIYRSIWDGTNWSIPEHAGTPMNSTYDDYFCSMFPGSNDVYFSSNRPGGSGGLDLYIARPNPLPPSAVTTVVGTVSDAATRTPLGATLTVRDIKTNSVVATFHSNDQDGAYVVVLTTGRSYVITSETPGYLFYSDRFDVPAASKNATIRKDVPMTRDQVRLLVYFEFNKSDLQPESAVDLDRAAEWLATNAAIRVELAGHTDNVGSADYNKRLSHDRARSVYNYLLGKGIAPARMTYEGYGLVHPVATNDTEEGRAQNRRVEFRIIK